MDQAQLAGQHKDDRINRDIFEDQIDLVLASWTEDSLERTDGRWQIPYPHDEGIEWRMSEATARHGAHGEIGPDGRVRRVSVVPAPYQQPHPPVFVASNASQETVEYCGDKGFIPTYFSGIGRAGKFGQAYVDRRASRRARLRARPEPGARALDAGRRHRRGRAPRDRRVRRRDLRATSTRR